MHTYIYTNTYVCSAPDIIHTYIHTYTQTCMYAGIANIHGARLRRRGRAI